MTEEKDLILPWDDEAAAEALGDPADNVAEGDGVADPAEVSKDPARSIKWRLELPEFFNRIDNGEYIPLKTGINFIDDLTGGGFIPGTITMIVADPGAGKTSLCQQLAAEFARSGYNVSFINYEMDEGQLYARDLAREVQPAKRDQERGIFYDRGIYAGAILRGDLSQARSKVAVEKSKRFREAVEEYKAEIYPRLYYNQFVMDEDENGNLTGKPRPIRNTAADLRLLTKLLLISYKQQRKAAAEAGEDLAKVHAPILFVDYIQLIATGSESKINALEEVTGILSGYAKEGNTLVFAISSASKESRRNTQTKKPKAEDDEDTVNAMEDEEAADDLPGKPIAIYCDKSRFGTPGKVSHVRFIGAASKFVAPTYTRPSFAGEYEKQGYLCKASANGASVLEYSAAYFISLNEDTRGDRSGGKSETPQKALSLAEVSAEINAANETPGTSETREKLEALKKSTGKRSGKKSDAAAADPAKKSRKKATDASGDPEEG